MGAETNQTNVRHNILTSEAPLSNPEALSYMNHKEITLLNALKTDGKKSKRTKANKTNQIIE